MDLLLARAKKLDAMVDSVLQYSSIRQTDRKKRRVDMNVVVSQVIAGIEAPEHILFHPCDGYERPNHKSRARGRYSLLRTPPPQIILALSN